MDETLSAEVCVVGAGPVGGSLACRLAAAGVSTVAVDRAPLPPMEHPDFDGRAYAIAAGSQALLDAAGLWAELPAPPCPIARIRVTDGRLGRPASRLFLDFDTAAAGAEAGPFGWMVEARGLRVALNARLRGLPALRVFAPAEARVERTASAIERMLEIFHKKKDYRVRVPLALLKQTEATKRTFNIVLGSIAGISLLVGGIGIMNIMLASVTERTREIGIRRAIGAKQAQIISQFLVETVVLSSVGGLIGIGFGMAVPSVIEYYAGMRTIITGWSILLSLGISVSVGIVFGLYPAYRASRLDPIVALRHE